jgi:hypothetical protein
VRGEGAVEGVSDQEHLPGVEGLGEVEGLDEAVAVEEGTEEGLGLGEGVEVRLADGSERGGDAVCERGGTPLGAVPAGRYRARSFLDSADPIRRIGRKEGRSIPPWRVARAEGVVQFRKESRRWRTRKDARGGSFAGGPTPS